MGTHHSAVSHEHLLYLLDEFTLWFNRWRSQARGLIFYQLPRQAVEVNPAAYRRLIVGAPDQKMEGVTRAKWIALLLCNSL